MNLPKDFIERTKAIMGNDFENFEKALDTESVVSIRLNPNKHNDFGDCKKVAWCENGFYLPQRPTYTLDPNFHAGAYYAQEASSMFVEQAIKQYVLNKDKIVALDLCAAPGGKSTHLLSLLPENSLIVANEVIKSRAKILYENLIKWGNTNVAITNNDAKDFCNLNNFFDLILVDAPCSGEGMFRKDNAAMDEWSINNVNLCAQRQQRIIADIWSALKPGGIMIYCTCTYNTQENEEQIQRLISTNDATSLPIKINAEWGITESLLPKIFTYRFYPHKTNGEGFCLSVVQKNGDAFGTSKTRQEKSALKQLPKSFSFVEKYIQNSELYNFYFCDSNILMRPKTLTDDMQIVANKLHCLYSGLNLGSIKGNDFVPSQELALCSKLNKSEFQNIDLEKDEALSYLHKDTIKNIGTQRGYNLICYNHNSLGWIKNIGNRANNLYPQEWKIRMNIK